MSFPKPVFIHYGLRSGACCSSIVTIFDCNYLAIGAISGSCKLYSTSTHLPVLDLFDDKENRSVMSAGQFGPNRLYVHVRSYAVLFLKFTQTYEKLGFNVEKTVLTNHYGFCRTISFNSLVYIPLYEGMNNAVNIIDNAYHERKVNVTVKNGKQHGMFMSLNFLEHSNSKDGFLICCFENGDMAVLNLQLSSVVVVVSAFSETIFASSVFGNLIAVASVKTSIKFYRFDADCLNEAKGITYPAEVGGCASLRFSPCGKYVASGYWDGSIRVHSVKSLKILALIAFHKSTVDYLDWQSVDNKRLLYACCKDGALSIWNLLKD